MSKRTKLLIILGFIVLAGLGSLAAYGIYRSNNNTAADISETVPDKTDSSTGQTLSAGSGNHVQGPETYGINPATPVMIGFAALIDQGILFEDMTTLQNGITDYFISAASSDTYPPASIVSLSNASCGFPSDDGRVTCSYNLKVNDDIELKGAMTVYTNGDVDITLKRDATTLYNATAHRTPEE